MSLYEILNIKPTSNLLEICLAYQTKCLNNPSSTFIYTKALKVLINKEKRIIHDANIYHISLENLINNNYYNELFNIDDYELIPFITWLNDFIDFFYDTKYCVNNSKYINTLELWYVEITNILFNLKEMIKSFYLI